MSGEVVNLRRARKAKARAQAEKTAAENRVAYGLSKADKALRQARDDLAARRLDGHFREPPSGEQ